MIQFTINQTPKYAIIEFSLPPVAIAPDVLTNLSPPDPIQKDFAHKGVILSGRGPIWLYGYLVHYYHPTKMIAIFDPRLQGAVVVSAHYPDYQEGMVIDKKDWE
jgi:CRISPR-associated protein Csx3